MRLIPPSSLLRLGLRVDAAGSGAVGLLHLAATKPLASLLAVPAGLVLGSGVFMLGYAAVLTLMASRPVLALWAVRTIVWGNSAYVLACLALALIWPDLNVYAVSHLLLQAAAVAGFVALQALGLRQGAAAPAD